MKKPTKKPTKKLLGLAIHQHSHGSDGYLFAYDANAVPMPSEAQVAAGLNIDYEPDDGEDLWVTGVSGVAGFGIPQVNDFAKLPMVTTE